MLILLIAQGCNLPFIREESTELPMPTPNLTMTALFSPLLTQKSEATSLVVTATQTSTYTPQPTTEMDVTDTPIVVTPSPTNTPIVSTATQSYAGPGMRSGSSVVANYLGAPPKIDGYLTEWSGEIYEVGYVVYGSDEWSGTDDLSATAMLGWDDDYLYVGLRVKDDIFSQMSTGENLYLGDSAEILIDVNVADDYYLSKLSGDDYQLGLSPGFSGGGSPEEAYLWFPRSLEGKRTSVIIKRVRTDNGYHLEAAVPWDIFGIRPYKGLHLGFAISVSDNDQVGKAIQESMVSNVKTRSLTNPMTWGDLTLGD